jgi:hypothetical protein
MRGLQVLGGVLALVASILLVRIVLHGYTDHGHLDVFHLLVAIGSALVGLFFVWRAFPSRGT